MVAVQWEPIPARIPVLLGQETLEPWLPDTSYSVIFKLSHSPPQTEALISGT